MNPSRPETALARLQSALRWGTINGAGLLGLGGIGYGLSLWLHPGAGLVAVGALLLCGACVGAFRTNLAGAAPESE